MPKPRKPKSDDAANKTYLAPHGLRVQWAKQRSFITRHGLLSEAQLKDCAAAAVSHGNMQLTRTNLLDHFRFTGTGHYTLLDDRGVFARVKNNGEGKWCAHFPGMRHEVTRASLRSVRVTKAA